MAKFELVAGERLLYAARSASGLSRAIDRDFNLWVKHFEGKESLSHPRYGNAINFAPKEILKTLSEYQAAASKGATLNVQQKRDFGILPPYDSIEGRLIRSTAVTGDSVQSYAVVLFWFVECGWQPSEIRNRGDELGKDYRTGMMLTFAARAARDALHAEMPEIRPKEIEERTLAAVGRVEDEAEKVILAIGTARRRTEEGAAKLVHRETLRARSRRKYERKVASYWRRKFESTYEAYVLKLRYEAPVELWTKRATAHSKAATAARNWFICLGIVFVVAALVATICFGDAIAASYIAIDCKSDNGSCFSPKGPLVTGALLLTASMFIWAMRLLYRTHITERLLAQDAKERQSFVETYYALVNDKKATADHEAIILGALFRPSREGTGVDEGGSVDLSSAAVLAKILAGPSVR